MGSSSVFSSKDFRVYIAAEATAGSFTLGSGTVYQLDVDSVGFPSLNVNQKLDVRNSAGRTFKDEDFYQDNIMRVVEMSLSGTVHNDTGHKLLIQNPANDFSGDVTIAVGWTPPAIEYDVANTTSGDTLTVMLVSPDATDGNYIVMNGLVVSSVNFSADNSTDGGQLKFNATLKSGRTPTLNGTTDANTYTPFIQTDTMYLSSASSRTVDSIAVMMQSFGVTIENEPVFAGSDSTGYEVVGRGDEVSVTAESIIKLDSLTRGLVSTFDTQVAAISDDAFVITNAGNWGVDIQNAVFTDVSYNEGDFMQLSAALKSVDDGTDPLITIDV